MFIDVSGASMLVVGSLFSATERFSSGETTILVKLGHSMLKKVFTIEHLGTNTCVVPCFSLTLQTTSSCHPFQVVAKVQPGE